MIIAIVPQKHIRNTAFVLAVPPRCEEIAPERAKNRIAKQYWKTTIVFIGANIATNKGKKAPVIKEAAEAMAACNGLGFVIKLMPNSSRACASKASLCVNSMATLR